MLKDRLDKMLLELNEHKRNKDELELYYVQLRLNTSLENYQEDLAEYVKYLKNRNLLKITKKLIK